MRESNDIKHIYRTGSSSCIVLFFIYDTGSLKIGDLVFSQI